MNTSDFNRHTFPSGGGWKFRQPQTNWDNPYAMVGFDASVKAIIKHREANKALTTQFNLSTDYDEVADELEAFNRRRVGLPAPPAPSFFQPGRSGPVGEAAAAGTNWYRRIVRTGTGMATLADWLGTDGKPVDPALAEQRAATCAGDPADPKTKCPQNQSGDLISFFVKPVAELLRRQLAERDNLGLKTGRDGQLGVCDACGCPLKLKVHVPLSFIKKHIKEPEWKQLDPRCWILRES